MKKLEKKEVSMKWLNGLNGLEVALVKGMFIALIGMMMVIAIAGFSGRPSRNGIVVNNLKPRISLVANIERGM